MLQGRKIYGICNPGIQNKNTTKLDILDTKKALLSESFQKKGVYGLKQGNDVVESAQAVAGRHSVTEYYV